MTRFGRPGLFFRIMLSAGSGTGGRVGIDGIRPAGTMSAVVGDGVRGNFSVFRVAGACRFVVARTLRRACDVFFLPERIDGSIRAASFIVGIGDNRLVAGRLIVGWAEEFELVRKNFRYIVFAVILIYPAASAKLSLDIDEGTLADLSLDAFRDALPRDDVVPFRFFRNFCAVLGTMTSFRGGQRK